MILADMYAAWVGCGIILAYIALVVILAHFLDKWASPKTESYYDREVSLDLDDDEEPVHRVTLKGLRAFGLADTVTLSATVKNHRSECENDDPDDEMLAAYRAGEQAGMQIILEALDHFICPCGTVLLGRAYCSQECHDADNLG